MDGVRGAIKDLFVSSAFKSRRKRGRKMDIEKYQMHVNTPTKKPDCT